MARKGRDDLEIMAGGDRAEDGGAAGINTGSMSMPFFK
jgi:hypothetical protein